MTSSRRRLAGLVLACCALAVACSNEASQPFSTPNATMMDGLSVLPLDSDVSGDVVITINDYAAAALAMGVEPPPDDAGPGEARDWIDQLFRGRLGLRLPDFVGTASVTTPEVVVAEFGWSPYDIEASAELLPLGADAPGIFAVLRGDLVWADDVELTGGAASIGERDGQIAASPSTDLMSGWIADDFVDATSDPGLLSAAIRLDAIDAYTAQLFRGDFADDGAGDSLATVIEEPFDVLAVGLSGEFADLTSMLVYVFEDDDAAGRAEARIDDGWRALDLSDVDGTFEITTIEQRDDAVVVIARVEDGPTSTAVVDEAREAGLLRHR